MQLLCQELKGGHRNELHLVFFHNGQ
jgi:hypothetical protein